MKTLTRFIVIGTAIFGLSFLQSCDNDDDNPPSTFPHTISFSHFEQVEFKMWTNGAEVNTDGLDFLNFIESDEYLIPEWYNQYPGFTFTQDSVSGTLPYGSVGVFPYFISNDSIYVEIDTFLGLDTICVGLGTPFNFNFVQCSTQFCEYDSVILLNECLTLGANKFYTFETASEAFQIPSLDYIGIGDTLIYNNRIVHFK